MQLEANQDTVECNKFFIQQLERWLNSRSTSLND